MRERVHRLRREDYVGRKAISFTACLRERRKILDEPGLVAAFVERLTEASDRFGCTVPVYTFMPDHLHALVLGVNDSSDGRSVMDRFKSSTGWWLYRNRPGFKWQKDYWDHIVRDGEGWEAQARYIALNPVRAGLVERGSIWPHTGSIGHDLQEILTDAFW